MKSLKKSKLNFSSLLTYWPYFLVSLLILGGVFVGSLKKDRIGSSSLSMSSLASSDFNVSSDQLSEFYMVASLADSLNLSSSEMVSSNYVTVSVMLNAGQSSTDHIEKPTIVDTSHLSRGIITHTVADEDTMESIASAYGVTTDQIRWSNGLKTTDISAGSILLVPSVPGIIYSAKSGDTVESIASKYSSNIEQIILYNDLETNATLSEGQKLVLPGGVLPETERPEYVAPVYRPTYYYTYSGSATSRENFAIVNYRFYTSSPGNPGVPGQCTWYAWYMRANDSRSLGQLPGGLGNANTWAYSLARAGYLVDRNPEVGAVFQTSVGYYGHVGYVTSINPDGSINVLEMNYNYRSYQVTSATIPANLVGSFNYIH